MENNKTVEVQVCKGEVCYKTTANNLNTFGVLLIGALIGVGLTYLLNNNQTKAVTSSRANNFLKAA